MNEIESANAVLRELVSNYRREYSDIPTNENERIMEHMLKLLSKCLEPEERIEVITKEVCATIHRMLGFRLICIALLDPRDGLYRYTQFTGYSKTARDAYMKLEYTLKDVFDTVKYPRIRVNRSVHFFPMEYHAYVSGEEGTYNKPSYLGKISRKSPDQWLDDDYLDVFMYDSQDRTIGWLELSTTRDGKMPSRQNIRWLEFLAHMLGITLSYKIRRGKSAHNHVNSEAGIVFSRR